MRRILESGMILILVLTLAGLVAAGTSTQNTGVTDRTADRVFGQPTFYTTTSATTAYQFNDPYSCAVDKQGSLWVVDEDNNRVLKFSASDGIPSDTTADLVIGQAGYTANYWGTSDTMLYSPRVAAFDRDGNLYVSEDRNLRVVRFNADSDGIVRDTTADLVIGQAGYGVRYTGISDTMFNNDKGGLAFDRDGNLYVADRNNNRVLRFDASSTGVVNDTTADFVIGQAGFLTGYSGTSDTQISDPAGVSIDASGNLFISESGNDRILRFNASGTGVVNDTTADLVFGQAGYGVSYTGTSDTMLNEPFGMAFDSLGSMWVADEGNRRILRFSANASGVVSDTTADFVIGGGDPNGGFDSAIAGTSDTMIREPKHMAYDGAGRLYVPDNDANRVLAFYPTILTFTDDDDCFLATAAYGDEAPELGAFHQFRDEVLMTSRIGRGLVSFYYTHGPSAASYVSGDASRFVTRTALTPVLGLVKIINTLGLFGAMMILTLIGVGAFALRRR